MAENGLKELSCVGSLTGLAPRSDWAEAPRLWSVVPILDAGAPWHRMTSPTRKREECFAPLLLALRAGWTANQA